MDEGESPRDRRIPKRAEPSGCTDGLPLEPRANDVHEKAIDEPRNDEFRSASCVDRLVAKKLEKKLKPHVPFGVVRRQVNERRQQRREGMWSDVLKQILCAEHHGRLVHARRRQRREATRHCIEHLPVGSRARLWAITDGVPDTTTDQDDVPGAQMMMTTITRGTQAARAPLNDVHVGLCDRVNLETPRCDELGLRNHGGAHPRHGEYVGQHVHATDRAYHGIGRMDAP